MHMFHGVHYEFDVGRSHRAAGREAIDDVVQFACGLVHFRSALIVCINRRMTRDLQ